MVSLIWFFVFSQWSWDVFLPEIREICLPSFLAETLAKQCLCQQEIRPYLRTLWPWICRKESDWSVISGWDISCFLPRYYRLLRKSHQNKSEIEKHASFLSLSSDPGWIPTHRSMKVSQLRINPMPSIMSYLCLFKNKHSLAS